MAETIQEIQEGPRTTLRVESTAIVVVAGAAEDIITFIIPAGCTHMFCQIKNTHGATAFDEFNILRRAHASGEWETIANAAGDYTTPQSPLIECSASPVTLASAASVYIRMEVEGMEAVKFQASGSAGASEAAIYATIR